MVDPSGGAHRAPRRTDLAWREILRAQAAGIFACDFVAVEPYSSGVCRPSCSSGSPRARCTSPASPRIQMPPGSPSRRAPSSPGRTLPRFVSSSMTETLSSALLLTTSFAPKASGSCALRSERRAPTLFLERFIGPLRRECPDRVLIHGRGHLESMLRVYIDHYNGHRPHRALDLQPPAPRYLPAFPPDSAGPVLRRDVLGGLIHEYERARAA